MFHILPAGSSRPAALLKTMPAAHTNREVKNTVTDKKAPCGHPDMCPEDDSFAARIKTDKLALAPPSPADLVSSSGRTPADSQAQAAE